MAYYRCDFNITSAENEDFQDIIGKPLCDSEYFECENDEAALCWAKDLAAQGTYFADAGHCGLELTYVAEVDEDTETFEEKRTIYY